MIRFLHALATYTFVAPLALLGAAWAGAAIWIDGPVHGIVGRVLAGAPLLVTLAGLVRLSLRRAALLSLTVVAVVAGWWSTIEPSNDRNWQPPVARPPSATFHGDLVTVRNVRNFDYRSESDYTERWEERTYDLSKVEGVDFYLSKWGAPGIAHTIVAWPFSDGQVLAVSIETRMEVGESYSAVLGFFKQFELYYVMADERDVIRLRSNYRGEDVYLYRLATPPDEARAFLVDYLQVATRLAEQPKWYNALTHNCTTTIRRHAQHVAQGRPWDWRILVNGNLDALGYERGSVDTSMPFEELRKISLITERAKAADQSPDFSRLIRVGLPRPAPK